MNYGILWNLIQLENFDVNVLVQGYQIEMMKVWNYMMLMHRNVWVGVAD